MNKLNEYLTEGSKHLFDTNHGSFYVMLFLSLLTVHLVVIFGIPQENAKQIGKITFLLAAAIPLIIYLVRVKYRKAIFKDDASRFLWIGSRALFTALFLMFCYVGGIGIIINIISMIVFIAMIYLIVKRFSNSSNSNDEYIRGSRMTGAEQLKKELERAGKKGPLVIAGVPLPIHSETRHIFLGGSIGSGKSLGIKELLEQARNAGQRAIVYDISGEFVEVFYRKDKDIIFNPLDKRSVVTKGWSLFKEIDQMYDLDSVAATLIPKSKGDASPYFVEAAQSVLASLMKRLIETGQETNERLYYYVAKAPIEELAAILEGTEGASHIGLRTDPKTSSNVRSTLTTKMRILGYLKDCGEASDFSLRKWVTEDSDSWIFITSRQAQQATLAPLLAFAIDRIGTFLLSLEPDRDRRIWISLDELSSLPRVQIETIMDKGRKYGACVLIGLQNINQLRDVYGEETAASLLSNCLTWVIYRTSDPTTAEYMSKKLGEQELYEHVSSISQKGSFVVETNGKNVTKQRTKKEIVLPSEIMNLDERIAYIKVEGNFPVVKTEFPIIQRKVQAPAFEAVDFSIQRGTPAMKAHAKEDPAIVPEAGPLSDDDEPPVG